MNYLQEAIKRVELSEGEATKNYSEWCVSTAQVFLQISIAQSLERIANALEEIKDTNEQNFDFTVNKAIHGELK